MKIGIRKGKGENEKVCCSSTSRKRFPFDLNYFFLTRAICKGELQHIKGAKFKISLKIIIRNSANGVDLNSNSIFHLLLV